MIRIRDRGSRQQHQSEGEPYQNTCHALIVPNRTGSRGAGVE